MSALGRKQTSRVAEPVVPLNPRTLQKLFNNVNLNLAQELGWTVPC